MTLCGGDWREPLDGQSARLLVRAQYHENLLHCSIGAVADRRDLEWRGPCNVARILDVCGG